MSLRKIGFLVLCITLGFFSCNNDDDSTDIPEVVIRDRAEQQIADNDSIINYLSTHFYNKSAFEGNSNPKIADLVITEITDEVITSDADSLLINAVGNPISLVFAETDYEYYILNLNQGNGSKSPNFCDNVFVTYEGFTLDDEVFDSAVTPVEFDLTSLIPAWRKVLPQFKIAENFVENSDGTVNYLNHGTGVMFIPSGLGYFSSTTTGISAYSPLVFKFELLQSTINDHDADGIPSYLEDLNNDGEFIVNFDDLTDETDDDTDGNGIPDYFDNDDDGDGVLTINEDFNNDGDPTNDIGPNGIPRYLDPEATESNV
ncbi:hypothetical protein CLV33_104242 [Jejuia pallidilutea]|uniref:Peptidyl-prolyl cis-trans isomerase n=1 Tax=Jejuia pallidilutea TaxID=504487 RepID=A0A362X459_9FLAO|nr:FKBP-type peptidyl-prolyl cis-trans isomerase [Jejuia pallidilutea]PQV49034.1 hypothetical protein CLV33_104242 [Jejuia pallidilutea]